MNFTDVININTPVGNLEKISLGGTDLWSAPEADLFVASYGSDATGDGSIINPFKTLERAYNASQDGDVIMLLTDINSTLSATIEKKVTITARSKNLIWTNNASITVSGTGDFTLRNLTFSSSYVGGSTNTACFKETGTGKLTVENVRFTNCHLSRFSGNANKTSALLANGSGGFFIRNVSVDNSVMHAFITYRETASNGYIDGVVCGDNCEFKSWLGAAISTERTDEYCGFICFGWNGRYAFQTVKNLVVSGGHKITAHGYYPSSNMMVSHITGEGQIHMSHWQNMTSLSDINIRGKIVCNKKHGIHGPIRGEITITDTNRTAADGNIFFEGYNGYQITQEDFASMTWGGADGFHLSLENNQIVLRAD